MKKFLYLAPRILSILFIVFISIFALDVFSEFESVPKMILALFMHLLPSLALVAMLVIAWKREIIGGVLFLAAGIFFTVFFHTFQDLIVFLLISFPLFVVGILFILNHPTKRKTQEA